MSSYSVVIPTKDRPDFLKRAVISVLQQKSIPERIVVVDNSTKESNKYENNNIINQLMKTTKIELIYKYLENCTNASIARNHGSRYTHSKYIGFLDDDDEWNRNKAKLQLKMLDEKTKASTCSYQILNYSNKLLKIVTISNISKLHNLLKYKNPLGGCSCMILEKELFENINGFDEKLLSSQDWDLWIRLSRKTTISSIRLPLVYYRSHKSINRITLNIESKYKGYRRVFIKHKSFLNKESILFELLLFRAKYYKNLNQSVFLYLVYNSILKRYSLICTLRLLKMLKYLKLKKTIIHHIKR